MLHRFQFENNLPHNKAKESSHTLVPVRIGVDGQRSRFKLTGESLNELYLAGMVEVMRGNAVDKG
jgi:hypothetical protein